MRISHKHKFIFLSKPKCASTSIRAALDPYSDIISDDRIPHYHHHVPASILKKHFDKMSWNWSGYFKFTCVRNPWDMLVSVYSFGKPDQEGNYFWQERIYDSNSRMTFKEWILKGRSWDFKQAKLLDDLSAYTLPYYILDENDNCLVDCIVSVENLENDLKYVSSKINIEIKEFHLNTSKHKSYREYYDEQTKKITASLFEKDIEYGKYVF